MAREFKIKKTADDLLADRAQTTPGAQATQVAPAAEQTSVLPPKSKRNRNAGKQQR